MSNGYPKLMVKRVLAITPQSKPTGNDDEDDGDTSEMEGKELLYLPYVKGVSERIERGCRQLGIQVVFRSGNKLRQSLMQVKSAIDEEMKKGVVYEVPCSECEMVYIGETGRNLKERIREHKYAVKKGNLNNGIAAHVWQHKHEIDWDSAKVRCKEQHLWKRKVLEAIHIQQTPNASNLDCGLQLNPVWLPLIKEQ